MFKTLFFVIMISVAVNAIDKVTEIVVKDLDGNDVSWKKFEGKCILVVNSASMCGLAHANMKYLNDLNAKHGDALVINVLPSDTFGQEPKTHPQLKDYFFKDWSAKYNVFGKICVKTSDPYVWLAKQAGAPKAPKVPEWNFVKYLIQKDGTTVSYFGPHEGALLHGQGLNAAIAGCV